MDFSNLIFYYLYKSWEKLNSLLRRVTQLDSNPVTGGYVCAPYLHNHNSIELKDTWAHSRNIEDMYFVTATFSQESKPYFSSSANHYILAKFKDNKKILKESIKEHVITNPDYLLVANLEGEWNMLIVMKVETGKKNPTSKIIERFSEQVIDYRISKFDIKNVNLLNMSLLLL